MFNNQASTGQRGFSLIETMVASAVLGIISASLLSTMSFSNKEIANSRVRAVAAADAQEQFDRIVVMAGVTGDDTIRCSLFQAAGGPMDTTTGGTASGTCPVNVGDALVVTGIPLRGTSLKRNVRLEARDIGASPGLVVEIEVAGPQLVAPVVITTQIRK